MGVVEEIIEEIFECKICLVKMKDTETALRLKDKDEDETCSLSYCEKCVSDNPDLKDKQTYMIRMLVSEALLKCDKETQEEIKQALMKDQPTQFEYIKDLFGLDRKIEFKDENGIILKTVIE